MLESQYQIELYHQEHGYVLFELSNKMYYDICDEFSAEMACLTPSEKSQSLKTIK